MAILMIGETDMTQPQLFIGLITTVLLCIGGTREILRRNFGMGILLIAIPVCGWVSMWVKP
jgi:hypothetical protein